MPERSTVHTRNAVAALLARGESVAAIARSLGLAKSTVCYHRRRLGHPIDARCNRRYDWQEVQRYYDSGHTARECRAHFGFAGKTWHDAVQHGAIVPRPAPPRSSSTSSRDDARTAVISRRGFSARA